MCVHPSVRPCPPGRQATFLKIKFWCSKHRSTFPKCSSGDGEMSKSLSRELRRRTEPSRAESQSQVEPGQAEHIAPSSCTQLPPAAPICISGLRPGLCGIQVENTCSNMLQRKARRFSILRSLRSPKPRFGWPKPVFVRCFFIPLRVHC